MAYARRAAALADELADWHRVYVARDRAAPAWTYDSSERAALQDRIVELQRMVIQLQDVASGLVALR